jgi:hypothetical protein
MADPVTMADPTIEKTSLLTRYVIDKANVTHDRLEDEVIIINATTGSYFSGLGPAADIWTLISQGASIAAAVKILASEYSCGEDEILTDVVTCVDLLIERNLVQRGDQASPPNDGLALPQAARKAWTVPGFDEHMDMWDLIKLDPIHETDDAGWPSARP